MEVFVLHMCLWVLYLYVYAIQENVPPPVSKRKADDIPYTPEKQHHVLKRLRQHHANPDGTLTLQSANHTDIKLFPLPQPHVGSHDCSIKTQQQ